MVASFGGGLLPAAKRLPLGWQVLSVAVEVGYIRQWRATDNTLEGTAAAHCDNLFCLDEIGQASSRVVSEVAYMLANGQGKARANKKGNAKAIQEWRLSFMSTEGLTLVDKIAEDGRRQAMPGQAVRVMDIPADGGTGQEIFTYIPSGLNRNSFSQQLVGAVGRFYGTALRRVLGCLVDGLEKHVPDVKQMSTEFVQAVCPEAASGQVKRVCQRLGLIAATREKAIDFGVLPWPEKTPRVRPSFVFSLGSRSAEESGIWRSKTPWTGSRPFSRNMRRLVSASSSEFFLCS